MKKLMFAVAALAAGVACAEITSTNIVGYSTTECAANTWYMIGCGFEGVDGNPFTVQNFATGMATGLEDAECSTIQVWNGTDLDTYIYIIDDEDEDGNYISHWLNAAGDQADFTVAPGFGCWINNPKDCSITVAGQVVATSKTTVEIPGNVWQLIANPYPVNAALNGDGIDCSHLATGLEDSECSVIQAWNGSDLDTYIYIIDDEDEDGNYISHWLDAAGDQTELVIPAQTGFWIIAPTDCEINWVR